MYAFTFHKSTANPYGHAFRSHLALFICLKNIEFILKGKCFDFERISDSLNFFLLLKRSTCYQRSAEQLETSPENCVDVCEIFFFILSSRIIRNESLEDVVYVWCLSSHKTFSSNSTGLIDRFKSVFVFVFINSLISTWLTYSRASKTIRRNEKHLMLLGRMPKLIIILLF